MQAQDLILVRDVNYFGRVIRQGSTFKKVDSDRYCLWENRGGIIMHCPTVELHFTSVNEEYFVKQYEDRSDRPADIAVAAAGEPSRDKPASLLDNASLTDRRVSAGVPPSDNTSQLAIAARNIVLYWKCSNMRDANLNGLFSNLDTALQQQA
jgi:hypothetical protein